MITTDNKIVNYNEISALLFDKKFRNEIRNNPTKHAESLGYGKGQGIEYAVKTSTKQVLYVVFPSVLSAEDLSKLQAAGNQGVGVLTLSSAGSAASVGSACSTVSTASSSGSVGTLGSIRV